MLYEAGEHLPCFAYQRRRRSHIMGLLNFDVGNPALQDLIAWVDQPPQQQGRDTHGIYFLLTHRDFQLPGGFEEISFHHGLLFFRPGTSPNSPSFQQQHGLSGTGSLVHKKPTNENPFWVRVEVRFRPPGPGRKQVNVAFHLTQDIAGFPSNIIRTVEVDNLTVAPNGFMDMDVSAETERWSLGEFKKRTVLFTPP